MSEEFIIPVTRDDLINRSASSQYIVDEILTLRQVPAALHELKQAVRSQPAKVLTDQFSSFFSFLCLQKDLTGPQKELAWDYVYKAATHPHYAQWVAKYGCSDVTRRKMNYEKKLRSFKEYLDHLSLAIQSTNFTDQRAFWLKSTKMACYLLCQFMDMHEGIATQPGASQMAEVTKGRGRAKSKKSVVDSGIEWSEERKKGVLLINTLVQLPLHKLWSPPIVEDDFVNMITKSACYGLLENHEVSKDKVTREIIFHILAVMVKHYNHSMGASLTITQLLQRCEHLASPLVQAAVIFTQKFGKQSVVTDIIREIASIEAEDFAKNLAGMRACATFLVELAEALPHVVSSSLSALLEHLECDDEPYQIVNCVLSVMTEVIVRVVLDDTTQKAMRDQLLDHLEEHLLDISPYVRSKCLQLWLHIIKKECLPLLRRESLVTKVLKRLEDVSCQVRKNAVQLLSTLVQCNPYAFKISVEELSSSHDQEKVKLETMKEHCHTAHQNTELDKVRSEWADIEADLRSYLEAVARGDTMDTTVFGDASSVLEAADIREDESHEEIFARLSTLLTTKKFSSLLPLLGSLKDSYPDLECFRNVTNEARDDMDVDQSESAIHTDSVHEQMTAFMKIFIEHKCGTLPVISPEEQAENDEITKQNLVVDYLRDTISFAKQTQQAIPLVCKLLSSKTPSVILEAIEFFVRTHQLGVHNSMMGVRAMLPLVWSTEQAIKETVVDAYKCLYLTPHSTNARNEAVVIVKNLYTLISGSTHGDMTSLEALVEEMYKRGDLNAAVVRVLWEQFTLKMADTSPQESHAALVLICMLARVESDIVRSNLDLLVTEGLGERATTDLLLPTLTCRALQTITSHKKSKPFRLLEGHEMFTRLADILTSSLCNTSESQWIPLGQQAVDVIYLLAEHPDKICADLIKQLCRKIVTESERQESGSEEQNENNEPSDVATEDNGDHPTDANDNAVPDANLDTTLPNSTPQFCHPDILSRVISIIGRVAFRQIIHLDVAIFDEMKRRHGKDEKGDTTKDESKAESSNADDEMGLSSAATEDAESEFIRNICETDLITGQNLLAMFGPLIITICTNQLRYKDKNLRSAATSALTNYMLVSSQFCNTQLQLLFTLLEKSPHETIRGNIIVALGDLMVRWPNLIEPWTPKLYARLRDNSLAVRKNSLHVLSHLILNNMVKVKGQISELALCIVDADDNISELSKFFFSKLAEQGNCVYNAMADMISCLSVESVPQDHFRTIMKFLFSFIEKDKQSESLVDKLCQRYSVMTTDTQWRDLSHCLSLLPYSLKSLAKLQENFSTYSDKLHDDEVHACFLTLVSNTRKGVIKPELKLALDEFEQKIAACRNQDGEEGDDAASGPTATKGKTPRKAAAKGKTPRKTLVRQGKKKTVSDSSDDDTSPPPKSKVQPPPRSQKVFVDSSESDSEDDSPLKKTPAPTRRSVRNTSKGSHSDADKENERQEPTSAYKTPTRSQRRLRNIMSPVT